jgi:hypothetical protein
MFYFLFNLLNLCSLKCENTLLIPSYIISTNIDVGEIFIFLLYECNRNMIDLLYNLPPSLPSFLPSFFASS